MARQRPLSEIAHEARTYLSVIQLSTEALLAKGEGSRNELETILKQVGSLTKLFDELASSAK